jgi:hypothetical protein
MGALGSGRACPSPCSSELAASRCGLSFGAADRAGRAGDGVAGVVALALGLASLCAASSSGSSGSAWLPHLRVSGGGQGRHETCRHVCFKAKGEASGAAKQQSTHPHPPPPRKSQPTPPRKSQPTPPRRCAQWLSAPGRLARPSRRRLSRPRARVPRPWAAWMRRTHLCACSGATRAAARRR